MFKSLFGKLKESILSIVPISLLVLILGLTPIGSFNSTEIIVFIISAIVLIIGMSLFNLGADIAMTPMGEYSGIGLTKSKKLIFLLIISFVLGFLITIAEPDLQVLSNQVESIINNTILIIIVGVGVGIFLLISIIRIIYQKDLSMLLFFFYMILFMLAALLINSGKGNLIPLSFDSGGVTTGPITVPFIMAFGVGIASTLGGKKSNENSFGLISLCSIGPILAVLFLCLFSDNNINYTLNDYSIDSNIFKIILDTIVEVIPALVLIFVFFIILDITILKLPKVKMKQILIGLIYTFFGLVLFLSSAKIGFLPIGYKLGVMLSNNNTLLIIFSFIIGSLTVIAEPAVHVLNRQVEKITDGNVSKRSMMIALSIGVGLSIALSILRIILDISILYFLIIGYLVSLGLSFFVPRIYTSIAFDSGGVASGPLTSTFVLPFAIGVCYSLSASTNEILEFAFGIVAMVALAPLITIQLLGFRAVASKNIRRSIIMKRVLDASDEEIIHFEV